METASCIGVGRPLDFTLGLLNDTEWDDRYASVSPCVALRTFLYLSLIQLSMVPGAPNCMGFRPLQSHLIHQQDPGLARVVCQRL